MNLRIETQANDQKSNKSEAGLKAKSDMKIIREPKIYLIAKQQMSHEELQRFMDDHGVKWESDSNIAAEVITESSGRICYMSFAKPRPGGNEAYLEHIKESGHGSVLEHAVWNFVVTGVSRSLTHELVRHRAGFAYSQLSQRYVDESVAEYVEPDIIAEDPELHDIWLKAITEMHQAYIQLAEKLTQNLKGQSAAPMPQGNAVRSNTEIRKMARQSARSILPNATETKISVTANARALRHFMEQRGSRYAEPEIRKLANKFLELLQIESPHLFGDYEKEYLPDGTFEIQTKYKKV